MRIWVRPATGRWDATEFFVGVRRFPYRAAVCMALLGRLPGHRSTRTRRMAAPFRRKENSPGPAAHRCQSCHVVLPPCAPVGGCRNIRPASLSANRVHARRPRDVTPFHRDDSTLALVPSQPCPIAVDTEPFPTSAFNDRSCESTVEYSLLQPRSALIHASVRLTPTPSQHGSRTPTHATAFQYRSTADYGWIA